MNRTTITLVTLGLLAATTACDQKTEQNIVTIDLIGNIDHANTGTLDSIFEITDIIKPELTDSTLLNFPDITGINGNRLYLQQSNSLMTFDIKTGKCLTSFSHTGQGPEEYLLLWRAWPGKPEGDWTTYDMQRRRVLRYTVDGKFVAAWPNDSIEYLVANGDGWTALGKISEGKNKVFYNYNNDMELTGSVVSGLPADVNKGTYFYTADKQAIICENDTLYAIKDHRYRRLERTKFSGSSYLCGHGATR